MLSNYQHISRSTVKKDTILDSTALNLQLDYYSVFVLNKKEFVQES